MASYRQRTAARLPGTSLGPACTTRCRMRVTTFPRRLQTHSPARSWNWQRFDPNQAECDAPDAGPAGTGLTGPTHNPWPLTWQARIGILALSNHTFRRMFRCALYLSNETVPCVITTGRATHPTSWLVQGMGLGAFYPIDG